MTSMRASASSAAQRSLQVHRRQFFLRHLVHAHSARMKGEAFGADALAGPQHRGDFGFHRRIGVGHDLLDAKWLLHSKHLEFELIETA
jgi:hypothetical protein